MQLTLPSVDIGLDAYVQDAVDLLREYEPIDKPYWGCFSGGKDSIVIKDLAQQAGVNVVWHYNVTTIDPPELVQHIRRQHPDVVFDRPPGNFFTIAKTKGFPIRRVRWCCEVFKERKTPEGEIMIFGVRAAEGVRRAKHWSEVSWNRRTKADVISPIFSWSTTLVWEYITDRELPYCSLYDEGWSRLGCIGCPMSGPAGRQRDFARWPKYEAKWKQLFQSVWNQRSGTLQANGKEWFGNVYFDSWEAMYDWWLNDGPLPTNECSGSLLF